MHRLTRQYGMCWSAAAALAACLAAAPLAADDKDKNREDRQRDTEQRSQRPDRPSGAYQVDLIKANTLLGMTIKDESGKEIGHVDEIILDETRTRVLYAVVSVGGWLNIGDKLCAVPLSGLEIAADEKSARLTLSKARMEQLIGFEKDRYPDVANPQLAEDPRELNRERAERSEQREPSQRVTVDTKGRHWSQDRRAFKLRAVNGIIGTEVQNDSDEALGDIEDLVIDQTEGRIAYAVVSFGGVLGVKEKLAIVPWSALQPQVNARAYQVNATRQTLDALAYEHGQEPNLADIETSRSLHKRFDIDPYWEVYGFSRTQVDAGKGWAAESRFVRDYDKSKAKKIEGTVQSLGTFYPERDSSAGMRLRIKTDEGTVVTVFTGPYAYLHEQKLTLGRGDRVTVEGAEAMVDGRSVLLAREIRKGNESIILRDAQGAPKWDAQKLNDAYREEYFHRIYYLDEYNRPAPQGQQRP